MKILFAVNNDNISKAISQKYQNIYKEIVSSKNVYYFNAIIKELQKDKSYDRVVISEELEPYTENNYDKIDNELFSKLDQISDEASGSVKEIPIIVIGTGRRTKSDSIILKLFGIGIYNLLVGNDRNYDEVCKLLNKPRNKKEAKIYYNIDSEDVSYSSANDDEVPETEIQNILIHYKKIGRNDAAIVSSFEDIASQYSDTQLRMIVRYLPIYVKATLELKSEKYQDLMMGGVRPQVAQNTDSVQKNPGYVVVNNQPQQNPNSIGMIKDEINIGRPQGTVVIPQGVSFNNPQPQPVQQQPVQPVPQPVQQPVVQPQVQQPAVQPQVQQPVAQPQQNFGGYGNQGYGTQGYGAPVQQQPVQEPQEVVLPNLNQISEEPKQEEINPVVEPVVEPIAEPVVETNEVVLPGMEPTVEPIIEEPVIEEPVIEDTNTLPGLDDIEIETPSENVSESSELDDLINSMSEQVNEVSEVSENEEVEETEEVAEEKRGRGRPRKYPKVEVDPNAPKRGRGRPRKEEVVQTVEEVQEEPVVEEPVAEEINLFDMANEVASIEPVVEQQVTEEINTLPGLEDVQIEEPVTLPGTEPVVEQANDVVLPGMDDIQIDEQPVEEPSVLPGLFDNIEDLNTVETVEQKPVENPSPVISNIAFEEPKPEVKPVVNNTKKVTTPVNIASLLTPNKKVVAFVGTSKNGTSFLVNNVAALLSGRKVNTAILDLTSNKNAYYIYTNNEDELMNKGKFGVDNLIKGIADGVPAGKNIKVYTSLPDEDEKFDNVQAILETLVKNHDVVLMDCDFNTNFEYFRAAQEVYLVQSYDILTIQPLTKFLRDLKDKNILVENRLRVVINKELNVKGLTREILVGGISSYNDPGLDYIKPLFDPKTVISTSVPLDDQSYAKYLEGVTNCEITLSGYSKAMLEALEIIADMVYPIVGRAPQGPVEPQFNSAPVQQQPQPMPQQNYGQPQQQPQFGGYGNQGYGAQQGSPYNINNSSMNDTLNKMRNNF